MSKITKEEVERIAKLAQIQIDEDDSLALAQDLEKILDFVDVLKSVDTEGVSPTTQVSGLSNVARTDDIIDYKSTPEELLKNVPDKQGRLIKVKRVL